MIVPHPEAGRFESVSNSERCTDGATRPTIDPGTRSEATQSALSNLKSAFQEPSRQCRLIRLSSFAGRGSQPRPSRREVLDIFRCWARARSFVRDLSDHDGRLVSSCCSDRRTDMAGQRKPAPPGVLLELPVFRGPEAAWLLRHLGRSVWRSISFPPRPFRDQAGGPMADRIEQLRELVKGYPMANGNSPRNMKLSIDRKQNMSTRPFPETRSPDSAWC